MCGGVNGSIFVSIISQQQSLWIHLEKPRGLSSFSRSFHDQNENDDSTLGTTCSVREKLLDSCAHLSERIRCLLYEEREKRRKKREKKKEDRGPRFTLFFFRIGRKGVERREKKKEDNAGSRVGAVLNGNRLVSEVPGSWVTWRQGDTVAPPTVRWICRLAARLPQGRSFRVRVDPSGRRDADVHTARPLDAERKEERIYTTATGLPCRFKLPLLRSGDDAALPSPATNVIAATLIGR